MGLAADSQEKSLDFIPGIFRFVDFLKNQRVTVRRERVGVGGMKL